MLLTYLFRIPSAVKKIVVSTIMAHAIIFLCISNANTATITAASCSEYDVQAAINLSASGDTVVVPSGNCTWSSTISIPNSKKITLQGAGKKSTLINGGQIAMNKSGSRITGFGFTGTVITIDGNGWRIDNNSFSYSTRTYAIDVANNTRYGTYHPTGLIDNNIFVKGAVLVRGNAWCETYNDNAWSWGIPTGLGTGENVVFIEDNIFTSGSSNEYYIDCMDSNYGGRFVFRYNTLYNTDTSLHGIQGANRGVARFEIYNNSYTTTQVFWCAIQIRSGTGVVYNNTITGVQTFNIVIDNQTSTRYGDYKEGVFPYWIACDGNNPRDGNRFGMEGYPCRDQIGRGQDIPQWSIGQPYNQQLSPVYFWNNIRNGQDVSAPIITKADPMADPPSNPNRHLLHLKANRDFYYSTGIQTSKGVPFDGSTGVGYGLLEYRPDTCNPLPVSTGVPGESGGGVAYWATDENILYRCAAPNTWVVHYRPYTYPHPLRQTQYWDNPPEPPRNLRIIE